MIGVPGFSRSNRVTSPIVQSLRCTNGIRCRPFQRTCKSRELQTKPFPISPN